MANMCADGFQLVSRRKAASRKLSKLSKKEQECESTSNEINIKPDAIATKLEEYKLELANSEFFSGVKETLFNLDLLPSNDHDNVSNEKQTSQSDHVKAPVEEMVLYGLGNFSTCPIACYQFALFMLLSEYLKVPNERCFLYDPRFRTCEKDVIKQLGFCLLHVNEVGKRHSKTKTLYYMPHCGSALYNNLLWANWQPEALRNTVILGNSFQTLAVRLPSNVMRKEFAYIHRHYVRDGMCNAYKKTFKCLYGLTSDLRNHLKSAYITVYQKLVDKESAKKEEKEILPYTTERELRNCFAHRDIFNDTSLHSFLKNDATSVADAANEMWSDVAEPSYDGTDHGNEIVWTEEKPTLMT